MRNKIFGIIGGLWGGSMLWRRLFAEAPAVAPNSAYQSGQTAATAFGALLLVVGLYYLFKRSD